MTVRCATFSLALLACTPDPGDTTTPEPDIQVLVGRLDFGQVEVGVDPAASYTLDIHNRGDAPLTIHEILVSDPEAPFHHALLGPYLVEPEAWVGLELFFDPPQDDRYAATLLIDSDDPDTPVVGVDLEGRGSAPAIGWSPEEVAFHGAGVQPISIDNTGSRLLTISDVTLTTDTDAIRIDPVADGNEDAEGLLDLEPGEATTLTTVRYAPVGAGAANGTLTITTNDPVHDQVEISIAATSTSR